MPSNHAYFQATRHPLPCLLVVGLLLFIYEATIQWLNAAGGYAARTGIDVWLGHALANGRVSWDWLPSLGLFMLILGWAVFAWKTEAPDLLGTTAGMALESIIAAVALWGLFYFQHPLIKACGLELGPSRAVLLGAAAASFVGAAVFEETVFRLIIFAAMLAGLKKIVGGWTAFALAVLLSSALFAAAHHVGAAGEPWQRSVFWFRMLAGGYFAILFQARGFGIAVGTHAFYDALVGLANH
jgi:hypothetical protein